jgi:hypothetical protein
VGSRGADVGPALRRRRQPFDVGGNPVDAAPFMVAAHATPMDGQGLACNPARCALAFGVRPAANVSNVAVVRISAAGAVLDATPIALTPAAANALNAAVASDGADFLVSWVAVDAGGGLQARRVLADGSLAGTAALLLRPPRRSCKTD